MITKSQNRPASHSAQHLDGQDDRFPADALVVVPASAPCGDKPAAAPVHNELARMSADRRRSESGDVGVRRAEDDLVHLERFAPAAAEKDAEVDRPFEALVREVGCCLVEK